MHYHLDIGAANITEGWATSLWWPGLSRDMSVACTSQSDSQVQQQDIFMNNQTI